MREILPALKSAGKLAVIAERYKAVSRIETPVM